MKSPFYAISGVQVAYFFVILVLTSWLLHQLLSLGVTKMKRIHISLIILYVFKIVGGACAIAVLSLDEFNIGLNIVVVLFDSVALRFILSSLIDWLIYARENDTSETKLEGSNIMDDSRLEKGTHMLLIAGIVLIVVGSALTSSNPTTGISLSKAGSVILALVVLMIAILALKEWKENRDQKTKQIVLMVASCIPFLGVRVAYSICSIFSQSGNPYLSYNKFAVLYGDWVYFCFMSFLMEVIIVGVLSVMSWVAWRRVSAVVVVV